MRQNKAMLQVNGETLLNRARRTLTEVGIRRVLVSGEFEGYDCVADGTPGLGPVAGIAAAADVWPRAEFLLIVPVDLPSIGTELLLSLMDAGWNAHFLGAPLPALFRNDARFRGTVCGMLQATTEPRLRSVGRLHEFLESQVLPIEPGREGALTSLNTPEQWQVWLSQNEGGHGERSDESAKYPI